MRMAKFVSGRFRSSSGDRNGAEKQEKPKIHPLDNLMRELTEMGRPETGRPETGRPDKPSPDSQRIWSKPPRPSPTSSRTARIRPTATTNGSFQSDFSLEEELEETSSALKRSQKELQDARNDLNEARSQLADTQYRLQCTQVQLNQRDTELHRTRANLQDAHSLLSACRVELQRLQRELQDAQDRLRESQDHLVEWERDALRKEALIQRLAVQRKRLLGDLQKTRNLLAASLLRVRQLESESQRVPALEARILQLEREQRADVGGDGEGEAAGTRAEEGKPRIRPHSGGDSGLFSDEDPSKERHSGESISTLDRERPRPERPKRSTDEEATGSPAPPSLQQMEAQLEWLDAQFHRAEMEWDQERHLLVTELKGSQDTVEALTTEIRQLDAERIRLLELEQRLRDVLHALRELDQMNVSRRALGRLIMAAVEQSVDPLTHECCPTRFLSHLHHSAQHFERHDDLMRLALLRQSTIT
ncbi:unnamed protein product [Darwinula stevensoni]|uniref:Uncharacterized protein n=1 Tax=Darwinula stevensoni TaxID=69355 RepID=A0A7R9A4B7_9CRUS|nr:unnamed protein product [Darwinula stevensoni]CAG0892233.1 unnamed protein product [Darwinula stevensoni]